MSQCKKCGTRLIGTAANPPMDQLCHYCERDIMRAGLLSVKYLTESSDGVIGLHLNGEIAPWYELRTGGSFGEWLKDFDSALDLIENK